MVGDSICSWYSRYLAKELEGKCEDMRHHSHEGNLACYKVIADFKKKELGIDE